MRWLWYVLIGVCLTIAIVVFASYSPGKLDHRYDGWVELVILTAIVFGGYLMKLGWQYRNRARFWQLYAILSLVHCAVFVPLFLRGWWFPVPLFAILGAVEAIVIATLIAWAMGEKF